MIVVWLRGGREETCKAWATSMGLEHLLRMLTDVYEVSTLT